MTREQERRRPSLSEESLTLLDHAIKFARSVLTECERNRMHDAANVLVFATLAKTLASARSARALIIRRHYWDAKLIIRSMLDSLVDVMYILHDPSQTRMLLKLFRIEMAVDQWDWLSYAARRQKTQPNQLSVRDPQLRTIECEYRWAKRQPEFHAKQGEWPKRWKYITQAEKIKAMGSSHRLWLDELHFSITEMGNAAAHSRGLALQTFVRPGDTPGRVKFTTNTGLHLDLANRRQLIMEPFVCVLVMSGVIIDSFQLGNHYERRLDALRKRWMSAVGKRSPQIERDSRRRTASTNRGLRLGGVT